MEFYPPFSFPLRVLKGTFEVSTGSPCQTKIKIKIKSDYARPFRAKARGGRKTSGLLAPNQSRAMPCTHINRGCKTIVLAALPLKHVRASQSSP